MKTFPAELLLSDSFRKKAGLGWQAPAGWRPNIKGTWCGPLGPGGNIAVVARADYCQNPQGTLAPWRTLVGNTEALASVTALSIHIYIQ